MLWSLAYEAAPIALMIEAAGGRATDVTTRTLDLIPETPHQNVALAFGAADEIDTIARYLAEAG